MLNFAIVTYTKNRRRNMNKLTVTSREELPALAFSNGSVSPALTSDMLSMSCKR